jgi:hypothetical protein
MPVTEVDESFECGIKKSLARLSSVGQYTALMEMLSNRDRDVSKDQEFKTLYEEFYKLGRYPAEFRDAGEWTLRAGGRA